MKLESSKIRALARARGLSLTALLERAGVSRTAYYSLARRPTVLPRTVHAVASALGVGASEILVDDTAAAFARIEEAQRICAREPSAAFDTVRHTLALLDLSPVDRLNASLRRGRAATV